MVLVMARWEAGLHQWRTNSKATLSQAKAKGNYQARSHSDQMVLVVVRQEAVLVAWSPRRSKRESENDSRDLTKNRQSENLKQESTYSFSGNDGEGR
jgi:hypothetical protein